MTRSKVNCREGVKRSGATLVSVLLLAFLTLSGRGASAEPTEPAKVDMADLAARPSRQMLPPRFRPGVVLHVSPHGSDANPGTARAPFASLERARDEIRALAAGRGLPKGGVEVRIHGGHYAVARSFELARADSGMEAAPIVYRAAEHESPVFSGAVRLRFSGPVADLAVRERLPAEVRDKVREVDLAQNGVKPWPLVLGGFASGRGFSSHPVPQLFWHGEPLPLARGPNHGTIRIEAVSEPITNGAPKGPPGSKTGRFVYEGDRPSRWAGEPALWLYGYWFFGWADSYERVSAIDPAKHEITLEPPYHHYGYRQGQEFYAVNALSELDVPGEWCIDAERGKVYLLPPDSSAGELEMAVAQSTLLDCVDVSWVRFEGITWECGCGDAVTVRGGDHLVLAGCTIRKFGGDGVQISGGTENGLLACDVCTMGRGGVTISGGNRKTLEGGNHFVENCHIYDLSRLDHTYTPAVLCSGVGNWITHNWFHDVASSAIRVGGNNHWIAYNEVNRVVTESDDQGGVDMFGNPTFLGNVYWRNFFHHVGGGTVSDESPRVGKAGIRLDDAITGVVICGNIFYRCGAGRSWFGAVQVHGGKDNRIENNVFAECSAAVSFTPWPSNHWASFTASPRAAEEIDSRLYSARYREMGRLDQDLNVNWIRDNVVLDCAEFLHRQSAATRATGNLITTNNPGFANPARGDFSVRGGRLKEKAPAFVPAPFEEIGLYRDRYRRALPEALRRKLRGE